jgi:hypothetical protein
MKRRKDIAMQYRGYFKEEYLITNGEVEEQGLAVSIVG